LRTITRLIAVTILGLCFGLAAAQSYPSKPVRIIVTNPPGGTVDILARTVGDHLGKTLGQPFIVENRPGANGNIGAEILTRAPADGYTLIVGPPGPFAINASLYAKLPYNPSTDFAPVSLLAVAPLVLVVNPSVPAKNLQELLQWIREQGRVGYASQGIASTGQLAMELLKSMTGVQMDHVPYKGSAPAIADLIAGHVKVAFDNTTSSLPYVRRGALRAIAVAEMHRLAAAPDIPTIDEQGLKGFEATPWFGIAARAGTPREIVERLSAEIAAGLKDPETQKKFLNLGVELRGTTPDAFSSYIRVETEKWSRIVKLSGAKLD
jgi:tripartite-type tricarboxylate transporter receptor subunit TctC